jgi:RimJ/RimL family protein N-acetyltransferase
MSSYIITTSRLGLRRWRDSDIKPFSEMNCDPDVMKFFPKMLSEEESVEMIQRINQHFEKNNFSLFAVDK